MSREGWTQIQILKSNHELQKPFFFFEKFSKSRGGEEDERRTCSQSPQIFFEIFSKSQAKGQSSNWNNKFTTEIKKKIPKKNSIYGWSLAKLKAVSNQPQKLLNFKYFDFISEGGDMDFFDKQP